MRETGGWSREGEIKMIRGRQTGTSSPRQMQLLCTAYANKNIQKGKRGGVESGKINELSMLEAGGYFGKGG